MALQKVTVCALGFWASRPQNFKILWVCGGVQNIFRLCLFLVGDAGHANPALRKAAACSGSAELRLEEREEKPCAIEDLEPPGPPCGAASKDRKAERVDHLEVRRPEPCIV